MGLGQTCGVWRHTQDPWRRIIQKTRIRRANLLDPCFSGSLRSNDLFSAYRARLCAAGFYPCHAQAPFGQILSSECDVAATASSAGSARTLSEKGSTITGPE